MAVAGRGAGEAREDPGSEMYALISDLYPLCRSITGDGVRETLRRVSRLIDLKIHEVPTGTHVFDWTVPKEWKIRDAYVENARGERVIDFRKSNLHVVSYSTPVRARMTLSELRPHLHTLPDHEEWIPYRTSYYDESWGFCLAHNDLMRLEEAEYQVCIDSSLQDGHLTYGELFVQGETQDEVLVHTHVCHPSMCNDNLSGIAVATYLARRVSSAPRRYSYRFLFVPGTIGAITWLALNEARLPAIRHGLVLSNLGDAGGLSYKKSRGGAAAIDRAALHVLRHRPDQPRVSEFSPYGYDERQYCSPGINLSVGSLSRSPWGSYPEYHTSADNLDLVAPQFLADSLEACLEILDVLEGDRVYRNLSPKGEPQLGRRGLYDGIGGRSVAPADRLALLWVLNLSDGEHSLLDVAERADLPFATIRRAADALLEANLLEDASRGASPQGGV